MPIGKLEPFDVSSKQWPAYIRRVKQYIQLNEIKSELHVSLLITVVGDVTYALMCDLCSPVHPESKKFEELVQLVSDHLEPQRSEIAERHVFRLRRQHNGESLTEYLQCLKHLASTCNFGATLEENLRDQFVSGLANETMRSRIFAEKSIKYKEAVELALALEAAERHAEMSGATAATDGGASCSGGSGGGAGEGLHRASARPAAAGARPRPGGGGGSGGAGFAGSRGGGSGGAGYAGSRGGAGGACWRCGKQHRPDRCRYVRYNCDECGVRGHLKVMCKSSGGRSGRHNYVSDDDDGEDFYNIEVDGTSDSPYIINVKVDGRKIEFEVDTGSRISTISELFYDRYFSHKVIVPDNLNLRSYVGSRMVSLGSVTVELLFGNVVAKNCKLHVIRNGGRPLLGREWVRALQINNIVIKLHEISDNKTIEVTDPLVKSLITQYPEVFTDKLGTCKRTFQLQLSDESPVYYRARPVPLALRSSVEAELQRLEREGTIYRVEYSEFGTPIVPVVKECGDIRICGDYKITINPKLKRDPYPLPRIEELFATLSGGEEYSKIDLKNSYQQFFLNEDSQKYTAITTHVGTFVYRRTPFGLSCIPEKFQKVMEETLRGVPNTVVFLDDICVTGPSRQKHMENLKAVLERLRNMGFTVKLSKCSFLQSSVQYLGFIIDKSGIRPNPKKTEAISNAPRPTDVTQLKSFLGMLNYYGKFIPNLSILLQPLHMLLKKGASWKWNTECESTFVAARQALVSERLLAHYEEGRPLVLAVDSSAYGLGAVLAHVYEDGSERPVSCVSRTLNSAERNYSQLDKEALAIFFGVTKHHQYLYGRRFLLRTDHQPLSYIFGEKVGIPQTAASRLQRWAARLAAYDFSVTFVRSQDNGPADALSRLPLPHERRPALKEPVAYVHLLREDMPVNFKEISDATGKDKVLSRIKGFVMFGWPASGTSCTEDIKPYYARRHEIVTELGCLIYKYRIIVPPLLQRRVLSEIHEGHLGVNKMKNLSRSYVYWPGLDEEIESMCRACEACRAVRDAPPRAALHPWEFPPSPWQRVHADFADCGGRKYLILVDAHSKWIEATAMNRTDAESTIAVFRSIFARFGLPVMLVTDNGPPFQSATFLEYCRKNCIKHVTSAPYRPQGNGAAENAVKTVKKAIKRALQEGENVSQALSKFLFQYRNVEHATTNVPPAVALLGRRLRGRLDAVRPDVGSVVRAAQDRQRLHHPGHDRDIAPGDRVLARGYSDKDKKWVEGIVTTKTGPVSYKVDVGNGRQLRRHQDQVIPVAQKNRFSLSRPNLSSFGRDESLLQPCDDADDTFEDATEEETSETAVAEEPRAARTEGSQETEPSPSLTPPPPGASARATRAYRRIMRK